nr:PREDICTED: tectonic-1 isoform X2 [Lepisosteus oculatus]
MPFPNSVPGFEGSTVCLRLLRAMAVSLRFLIFFNFASITRLQTFTTSLAQSGDTGATTANEPFPPADTNDFNTTAENFAAASVSQTAGAAPEPPTAESAETGAAQPTSASGFPSPLSTPETNTAPQPEATARSDVSPRAEAPTAATTSVPSSRPLPLSGSLPPPITNVANVCPCDLLASQCDVNCCCDRDCEGDFALFTTCTVDRLIADSRLCSQQAALYTINTEDGLAQVESTVAQEINPGVFCIQTANYKDGLSFASPEIPTDGNFDSLFRQFGGFFFSPADGGGTDTAPDRADLQAASGYQYGDVIQTVDGARIRGVLKLPAPTATSQCSDTNPAAFLENQVTQCSRSLNIAAECTKLTALSQQSYLSFQVLSVKNDINKLVNVSVSSITLQALNGARSRLGSADSSLYNPVLLEESSVCNNAVLQVGYVVTYSEAGAIVNIAVSFVLGAVDSSKVPIQQKFQITFVQENTSPVPVSGNPGYVVGLPLVAGWRQDDSGIAQSANSFAGLTVLKSASLQDCLETAGERTPVLFGVNMVSGCTLRVNSADNCTVVSEQTLGVLRGQEFPQYVASFGNSQPQDILDWVPVKIQTTTASSTSCSIPLSLDIEVRWTKYGSLANPQARILNVTASISTNSSSLPSLAGGEGILQISTSVAFVDVSAPAQPGYRAQPTIDAKLPFDFFFPFV